MSFYRITTVALCILVGSFQNVIRNLSAPVFPIEAHRWGLGAIPTGIITGTFDVTAILVILNIPSYVSSNNEKQLYIMGGLGSGFSVASFGLAYYSPSKIYFALISFFSCLVFGFFGAFVFACAYSISTSILPHKRIEITNALQVFIGIGSAAGPLLGGVLFSQFGYSLTFLIPGNTYVVITLICTGFLLKLSREDSINKAKELLKSTQVLHFILNQHILVVGLPVFLAGLHMGLRNTSCAAYINQVYGYNLEDISVIFSVRPITFTMSSFLNTFLMKKGYSPHLLCFSAFVYTVQSFLFYIPEVFPRIGIRAYFFLNFILQGYALSFVNAPFYIVLEWISKARDLPHANKVLFAAWFSITEVVGNWIGCVIFGGVLVDFFGYPISNLLCSILDAFSFTLLLVFMLRHSYFSEFTNDL